MWAVKCVASKVLESFSCCPIDGKYQKWDIRDYALSAGLILTIGGIAIAAFQKLIVLAVLFAVGAISILIGMYNVRRVKKLEFQKERSESLEAKIERLGKMDTELEIKIRELSSTKAGIELGIRQLQGELEKLGKERDRLAKFNDEHREALGIFKNLSTRIETSASSLETNVGEQAQLLQLVSATQTVTRQEHASLQKVLSDILAGETRLEILQEQLKEINQRMEMNLKKAEELEQRLSELAAASQQNTADAGDRLGQIGAIQTQIHHLLSYLAAQTGSAPPLLPAASSLVAARA